MQASDEASRDQLAMTMAVNGDVTDFNEQMSSAVGAVWAVARRSTTIWPTTTKKPVHLMSMNGAEVKQVRANAL